MNWFFSIVRIVGVSFPGSASLVQAQAELDSRVTQARLRRLEDPIAGLHPDIPDLAALLYATLSEAGLGPTVLTEDQYARYSKPLAILESQRYFSATHGLNKRYLGGLTFTNPQFVIYMAAHHEDPAKMDILVDRLENCAKGRWLKGADIAGELKLPVRTVRSLFEMAAAKGLGLMSNEVGTANYMSQA